MHTVRAFRFAIAVLLFLVAVVAASQGDWLTGVGAFVSSGFATLGGVAVRNRESLVVSDEIGWRQMEPALYPWLDLTFVLTLLFSIVPVALHALP